MLHELVVESLKVRLDKYLAEQLPEVSRSQIQRDIEGGYVEVNGGVITESKFVVRLDDKISYRQPEKQEQAIVPTKLTLKILYNDHGLIIIDKPPGLTVHPGAGFKGQTLASALLYQFKDIHLVGEEHRPGIVHRLDKDTSGVILVASTKAMYEHLKNAFADRKVKKEYIALVLGKVEKSHGIIDSPMGKSNSDFRKQTVKNPNDPKPAVTEYQVLEHLAAGVDNYSLLKVKLHTGRTHQIRVHLTSIGHPLMGDDLYGGKKVKLEGLSRQFLHAAKIEVQLPDKTWIEAESQLPDDLKKVLKNLGSKMLNKLLV